MQRALGTPHASHNHMLGDAVRSLYSMSFGWIIVACGAACLLMVAWNLAALGLKRHPASPRFHVPGGRPSHGARLVREYGCGGCHVVPGVPNADGRVGPRLDEVGREIYIAGVLANTPENMVRWIRDPQQVDPLSAMPNLSVSERDARDIAAFLYGLSGDGR